MSMNDEVIAYLRQNNIAFAAGDYSTGQQGDGAEQILTWNTAKLGAQPSLAQRPTLPFLLLQQQTQPIRLKPTMLQL